MKKAIVIMLAVLVALFAFVSCDEGMADLFGFEVSFNANGGSGEMESVWVQGSSTTAPENTFEREGYSFVSWNTKADGTGDEYEVGATINGSQITSIALYAQWSVNSYEVSFDANGGSGTMNDQAFEYDQDATALTANAFTYTGYAFTGWNTESDGTGTAYADEEEIQNLTAVDEAEITLYAQWEVDVYSISVASADNGSAAVSISAYSTSDNAIIVPVTFSPSTGYELESCTVTGSASFDSETSSLVIPAGATGDITLTPSFSAIVYTITLKPTVRGTSSASVSSYKISEEAVEVTLTATPVEGYALFDWKYDAPTGVTISNNVMTIPAGVVGNIVITPDFLPMFTITLYDGTNVVTADKFNDGTFTSYYFYGETVTLPTNDDVAWTGHSLGSWYTDSGLTAGNEVTVIENTDGGNKKFWGDWDINTYTIVFNANGGSGTMSNQVFEYDQVATALTANAFTKTGYTFAGWNTVAAPTEEDAGKAYGDAEEVQNLTEEDAAIITLYAQWTANSYEVSFDANGGTIAEGKGVTSYTYGVGATLPTADDISRTGYTFSGWYADSEFSGSAVTSISTTDTGAKTFYAKWTANVYTVTLDPNDGTIAEGKDVSSYTYAVGATLPTEDDISRTGYTFGGWYADSELSGDAVTAISTTDTEDKEFYAKWTANSYSIVFNKNGADCTTTMDNQEFEYDQDATALTANAFTKTGYTFAGWNTVAAPTVENAGTAYADKAEVQNLTAVDEAEITLYAQWTANSYKVSFDANGGSGTMANQSFKYDQVATALTTNTFTNAAYYYFDGWNTKADGTGTAYANGVAVQNLTSEVDATVTLYAQWKLKQYNVTITNDASATVYQSATVYTYSASDDTEVTFTIDSSYSITGYTLSAPATAVVAFDQNNKKLTITSGSYGAVTVTLTLESEAL